MKPMFLVVDKPAGITSHDVVAAVRAVTGAKKVGHTGTLDPFATGVLPLALGPATRLIQFLDESHKVYDATIALGTRTDTGDPTGQVELEQPVPTITKAQVLEVLDGFIGDRMQTPPAFSAVKKGGKPLYHYARKGEKVEVPARKITIYGLELLELDADRLRVRIDCSRGTYARVLANEIAEALGTVGHLAALARERSGPFSLEDALDFPTLAGMVAAEEGKSWEEVLLSRGRREERVKWRKRDEVLDAIQPYAKRPIDCLAHLPLADVQEAGEKRIRSGGIPQTVPTAVQAGGRFLVVNGDRVVAVAERGPNGAKVVRVF